MSEEMSIRAMAEEVISRLRASGLLRYESVTWVHGRIVTAVDVAELELDVWKKMHNPAFNDPEHGVSVAGFIVDELIECGHVVDRKNDAATAKVIEAMEEFKRKGYYP